MVCRGIWLTEIESSPTIPHSVVTLLPQRRPIQNYK
ncbi:unnamed protein product [Brassica oleracea var. botrytis]